MKTNEEIIEMIEAIHGMEGWDVNMQREKIKRACAQRGLNFDPNNLGVGPSRLYDAGDSRGAWAKPRLVEEVQYGPDWNISDAHRLQCRHTPDIDLVWEDGLGRQFRA